MYKSYFILMKEKIFKTMFPDSTNIFKALLSHKDKLLEQILSAGAPVLIVNFNDLLISSTVIVQDILRVKNISSFLSSQIVEKKVV